MSGESELYLRLDELCFALVWPSRLTGHNWLRSKKFMYWFEPINTRVPESNSVFEIFNLLGWQPTGVQYNSNQQGKTKTDPGHWSIRVYGGKRLSCVDNALCCKKAYDEWMRSDLHQEVIYMNPVCTINEAFYYAVTQWKCQCRNPRKRDPFSFPHTKEATHSNRIMQTFKIITPLGPFSYFILLTSHCYCIRVSHMPAIDPTES